MDSSRLKAGAGEKDLLGDTPPQRLQMSRSNSDVRRARVPELLLQRAAEQLQVLGQTIRLQIVDLLAGAEQTPQSLASTLNLSQQSVSKHLQVLYGAGLVRRRRDGTRVLYELTDDGILDLLESFARQLARRLQQVSARAQGVT